MPVRRLRFCGELEKTLIGDGGELGVDGTSVTGGDAGETSDADETGDADRIWAHPRIRGHSRRPLGMTSAPLVK